MEEHTVSGHFFTYIDIILTRVTVVRFNKPSMLLFGMQDNCALFRASPQHRLIRRNPAKTPLIT